MAGCLCLGRPRTKEELPAGTTARSEATAKGSEVATDVQHAEPASNAAHATVAVANISHKAHKQPHAATDSNQHHEALQDKTNSNMPVDPAGAPARKSDPRDDWRKQGLVSISAAAASHKRRPASSGRSAAPTAGPAQHDPTTPPPANKPRPRAADIPIAGENTKPGGKPGQFDHSPESVLWHSSSLRPSVSQTSSALSSFRASPGDSHGSVSSSGSRPAGVGQKVVWHNHSMFRADSTASDDSPSCLSVLKPLRQGLDGQRASPPLANQPAQPQELPAPAPAAEATPAANPRAVWRSHAARHSSEPAQRTMKAGAHSRSDQAASSNALWTGGTEDATVTEPCPAPSEQMLPWASITTVASHPPSVASIPLFDAEGEQFSKHYNPLLTRGSFDSCLSSDQSVFLRSIPTSPPTSLTAKSRLGLDPSFARPHSISSIAETEDKLQIEPAGPEQAASCAVTTAAPARSGGSGRASECQEPQQGGERVDGGNDAPAAVLTAADKPQSMQNSASTSTTPAAGAAAAAAAAAAQQPSAVQCAEKTSLRTVGMAQLASAASRARRQLKEASEALHASPTPAEGHRPLTPAAEERSPLPADVPRTQAPGSAPADVIAQLSAAASSDCRKQPAVAGRAMDMLAEAPLGGTTFTTNALIATPEASCMSAILNSAFRDACTMDVASLGAFTAADLASLASVLPLDTTARQQAAAGQPQQQHGVDAAGAKAEPPAKQPVATARHSEIPEEQHRPGGPSADEEPGESHPQRPQPATPIAATKQPLEAATLPAAASAVYGSPAEGPAGPAVGAASPAPATPPLARSESPSMPLQQAARTAGPSNSTSPAAPSLATPQLELSESPSMPAQRPARTAVPTGTPPAASPAPTTPQLQVSASPSMAARHPVRPADAQRDSKKSLDDLASWLDSKLAAAKGAGTTAAKASPAPASKLPRASSLRHSTTSALPRAPAAAAQGPKSFRSSTGKLLPRAKSAKPEMSLTDMMAWLDAKLGSSSAAKPAQATASAALTASAASTATASAKHADTGGGAADNNSTAEPAKQVESHAAKAMQPGPTSATTGGSTAAGAASTAPAPAEPGSQEANHAAQTPRRGSCSSASSSSSAAAASTPEAVLISPTLQHMDPDCAATRPSVISVRAPTQQPVHASRATGAVSGRVVAAPSSASLIQVTQQTECPTAVAAVPVLLIEDSTVSTASVPNASSSDSGFAQAQTSHPQPLQPLVKAVAPRSAATPSRLQETPTNPSMTAAPAPKQTAEEMLQWLNATLAKKGTPGASKPAQARPSARTATAQPAAVAGSQVTSASSAKPPAPASAVKTSLTSASGRPVRAQTPKGQAPKGVAAAGTGDLLAWLDAKIAAAKQQA